MDLRKGALYVKQKMLIFLAVILFGLSSLNAIAGGPRVVVNGEPLSPAQITWLQATYRTKLVSGDYWYDRKSGIWGLKGGPGIGVIIRTLSAIIPAPQLAVIDEPA